MAVFLEKLQKTGADFRNRHRFQSGIAFHVSLRVNIKICVKTQRQPYLRARIATVGQKSRLTLPVSGIGWRRAAKLLLPGLTQRRQPIRMRFDALADQLLRHAHLPQVGTHSHRSVAARGVQCNETFHIAVIIQQPIRLQSFDDRIDHRPIKAFADQLSRQLSGDMIASRQHIKSSRARSPGVEGI
jgi:hypothetical protein